MAYLQHVTSEKMAAISTARLQHVKRHLRHAEPCLVRFFSPVETAKFTLGTEDNAGGSEHGDTHDL